VRVLFFTHHPSINHLAILNPQSINNRSRSRTFGLSNLPKLLWCFTSTKIIYFFLVSQTRCLTGLLIWGLRLGEIFAFAIRSSLRERVGGVSLFISYELMFFILFYLILFYFFVCLFACLFLVSSSFLVVRT